MEPHQIPNALLGSLGGRTFINVFFPMLYSKHRSSTVLSPPEMQRWYDSVMRPAAFAVAPIAAASWPATYDAEMFKRACGGALQSVSLEAADVPALGAEIQCRLADQDWGQGAFFLTISGGQEDFQSDDGGGQLSVVPHFEDLVGSVTQGLNLDMLYAMDTTDDGCYVQVGTEVMVDGHSVFWKTKGQKYLLEEIFPRSTVEEREKWTQRHYNGYTQEPVSQFTEISGFRFKVWYWTMPSYTADGIIPQPEEQQPNTYNVTYVHASHMNKGLAHRLHQEGIKKGLGADAVLTKEGSRWFKRMYSVYQEAARDRDAEAACLQVCVPIRNAQNVVLSGTTLLESTLVIPPHVMWSVPGISHWGLRKTDPWNMFSGNSNNFV
jgi:hypothetical protein